MTARLTLLTQADCALCEHAKAVLAKLGAQVSLTVQEVDLASPQGQQYAAQGWMAFAPGLLIDGQPFGFGRLSERRLRKALSHHTNTRL